MIEGAQRTAVYDRTYSRIRHRLAVCRQGTASLQGTVFDARVDHSTFPAAAHGHGWSCGCFAIGLRTRERIRPEILAQDAVTAEHPAEIRPGICSIGSRIRIRQRLAHIHDRCIHAASTRTGRRISQMLRIRTGIPGRYIDCTCAVQPGRIQIRLNRIID